jgi:tetratricopeptide (TPR) repeat protein
MKPIAIAAIIFAVALTAAADEKKANELIQAAQAMETVQGDLKAAIALYGQAAKDAGANRTLAVKSLLRMAECYQKMGDAEAKKIYEQIVRDYGDQKEAVAQARERLGGATPQARQSNSLVWNAKNKPRFIPGVSADGRFIAFTEPDTGDVALHEIATDVDRRITNLGKHSGESAYLAIVSRDGKLAFYDFWNKKDDLLELRIANTAGDPNPRRLYANHDFDSGTSTSRSSRNRSSRSRSSSF